MHEHESCKSRLSPDKKDGGRVKVKGSSPKAEGKEKKARKPKGKARGVTKDMTKDMIERRIEELEKQRPSAGAAVAVDTLVMKAEASDISGKLQQQILQTQRLRLDIVAQEEKAECVNKETAQILLEVEQANDKKAKLESICADLQKQNKVVLDGVRLSGEEEQQKRKELSESFSQTINEITAQMEEQAQERLTMAQANDGLREEINQLKDELLRREAVFQEQLAKRDGEVAAVHSRLKGVEGQFAKKEEQFEECRRQMEDQQQSEEALRAQLQLYSTKFEHFQATLTRANPVFGVYKAEMDRMSTRIKSLETTNAQMRDTTAKADAKIVDLTEEAAHRAPRLAQLEAEHQRLTQLCKALTSERAALRAAA
eukprot:TRINITY_DN8160_c0_g1_i1.p1 TRINITY_DN8160_c0_g1~~TRINITY_DN8160_c0_g1_i1.p1  ORF type:complete len:371 (+),score=103.01 TRINITY_DN8160_c0_g1_i1:42-1154(+)